MKPRRVLAVALMALLLARTSAAIPILDDPFTIYLLKVVANILTTIQEIELAAQSIIQGKIDLIVSGYASRRCS